MTDEPIPEGADAATELVDAYPVEEVRALFVTFAKALRAFQLYDENNPVYQRFVSALRSAFEHLWTELDELTVAVQEDVLVYEGTEVYKGSSRTESLAWLLYKDGLRELTILPGVEEETEDFLTVLQQARHARSDGDDLLTLLWEAELASVKYFYVDLLAEGVDMPEDGASPSQADIRVVLDEEVQDGKPTLSSGPLTPTPELVNRDDFNPTLYALDPREMDHLRSEIEREMARNVRGAVLDALLDRIEERDRHERQSEILGIFQTLLPTLLSRGALAPTARLLAELRRMESEAVLDGERRKELTGLLDELSSGETVRELVRAIEDGSLTPDPAELGALLKHLRGGALAPLVRATELMERRDLQPVIRESVRGIASQNLQELARLLAHDDPVVVAGAARLAAQLKLTAITGALSTLFRHPVPDVRLAAIEAAVGLRATTVSSGLEVTLDDPERDVRIAAARALGTLGYRPATKKLREVLNSRELREADLSERIAFFEAFGRVGQEEAIGYLDKILNRRGLLGRRHSAELRACAALGLGQVDTSEARSALEVAAQEEDPVVRSAVNRALRRGGQG